MLEHITLEHGTQNIKTQCTARHRALEGGALEHTLLHEYLENGFG